MDGCRMGSPAIPSCGEAGRGQKAEGRGQKAEVFSGRFRALLQFAPAKPARSTKSEIGGGSTKIVVTPGFTSAFCLLPSAFCPPFCLILGDVRRRRIVGTAGHIDHGKTTLVRALT